VSKYVSYTKRRFETAAMMFGAWKAGSSGCSRFGISKLGALQIYRGFEVRTVVKIHPPRMHTQV
jgi:hypothetical protein